jgi:hypothetical protein
VHIYIPHLMSACGRSHLLEGLSAMLMHHSIQIATTLELTYVLEIKMSILYWPKQSGCHLYVQFMWERLLDYYFALNWVHELPLGPIDLELDSKLVVDNFSSQTFAMLQNLVIFFVIIDLSTKFCDVLRHCRSLFFTYYEYFNIECIKRQANEIVRLLTTSATSLVNF